MNIMAKKIDGLDHRGIGVTLSDTITYDKLNFRPFPMQQHCTDTDLCFILMPFERAFDNVYNAIKSVVQDYSGFTCLRADEIATPSQITSDIWERIQRARFLIADITGSNPNVFYEVGFSHAVRKNVILLIQDGNKTPFNIQDLRSIPYVATDLSTLQRDLRLSIKQCLETVPHQWKTETFSGTPSVRISHLTRPKIATINLRFQIAIHATNFGSDAQQGYFSVSFPSGIRDVKIISSDINTRIGQENNTWRSGEVVLRYPSAEAYVYKTGWPSRATHFMTVEAIPTRPGLIQFYISSSAQTGNQLFVMDPENSTLRDQRNEPVYCGVIEVQ